MWFVFLIFIFMLTFYSAKKKKIWHLLFLLIISFALFNVLIDSSFYSNLQARKYYTGIVRLKLWEASFKIFKDNILFGSGPGTFGKLYSSYADNEMKYFIEYMNLSDKIDAHSGFFTRLAELGILGFIAYLIFYSFLLFSLRDISIIRGSLNFSFFCFILLSFLSDFIYGELGFKLFWIFLGIYLKFITKSITYG